jgi:phosphoglycolate phosphatase
MLICRFYQATPKSAIARHAIGIRNDAGLTMATDHNPSKIQGIVFDKDGTLIDFEKTWVPILLSSAGALAETVGRGEMAETMLDAAGRDPATGRIIAGSQLASGTTDVVAARWREILPELPDLEEVTKWLDAYWTTTGLANLHPVTSLAPLLEGLRDDGHAIGLATNDAERAARLTLEQLGVGDLFDLVLGYDSGHGAKPEPGMILEFCRALDLPPDAVAMVGDSPADLDAGRVAGCGLVVAVLTGASDRVLLAPMADHVLNDISELPGIL